MKRFVQFFKNYKRELLAGILVFLFFLFKDLIFTFFGF